MELFDDDRRVKRASAGESPAVMPYYCYARQTAGQTARAISANGRRSLLETARSEPRLDAGFATRRRFRAISTVPVDHLY